jgi:LCP family protein required for cell wall assembly
MRKTRRVFGWLFFLALASAAAGALLMMNRIGGKGGIKDVFSSVVNPRGYFPNKDRITVLLIGKDYDRDRKGMPYTKTFEHNADGTVRTINSRADSIVLLSLDLENRKIAALSIPRDTRVEAPDGKVGKINATYMRGGAPLLRQTVQKLLGVAPDYVVALKADAVREIVDALGGVEVETLDTMKYDDNWGQLHIDLPKGKQWIDGTKAVGFTRFRKRNHGLPPSLEEGDQRRMRRQQQLIRALIARGKDPKNLLHADTIIETALAQVETDLKREQIFALGSLFKNVQTEQVVGEPLRGRDAMISRMYYFVPDPEKIEPLVAWLIQGDEEAANQLTVVAVKNGTQIPGVARRVAEMLRSRGGFDAASMSSLPEDHPGSTEVAATRIVYAKAANETRARRVATLLGGGQLVKEMAPDKAGVLKYGDALPADVTVVLGRDLAVNFAPRSATR